MKDLTIFLENTDKFESLYTILVYNIKLRTIIDYIDNILNRISTINNIYKRKYLNNRLFNFKIFLLENYSESDILNNLFLVGNVINNFVLTKEDILELTEFKIKDIIFLNGEYFNIEYINDLLNNKDYNYILHVDNKTLELIKFTKTKKKILDKITSSNLDIKKYIKDNKLNNLSLIYGISSLIKNIKIDNIEVIHKNISILEILDIIYKKKMLLRHAELEKYLLLLNHDKTIHRVRFGKEIPQSIINQELKILFCTNKRKQKIMKKFSKDLINFEIIKIDSLEKNDIGYDLVNKYKSAVGITYY